jgi:hypothetical protein
MLTSSSFPTTGSLASYLVHIAASSEVRITPEQVRDVVLALLRPSVSTGHVGGTNIARALGKVHSANFWSGAAGDWELDATRPSLAGASRGV